jgi:hypothetical protein
MNSFRDGVLIGYVMNVRMTRYAEQYIDKAVECTDDGLFWLTNVTFRGFTLNSGA